MRGSEGCSGSYLSFSVLNIVSGVDYFSGYCVKGSSRLVAKLILCFQHMVINSGHFQKVRQRHIIAVLLQRSGYGEHIQLLSVRCLSLSKRGCCLCQRLESSKLHCFTVILRNVYLLTKLIVNQGRSHQANKVLVIECLIVGGG